MLGDLEYILEALCDGMEQQNHAEWLETLGEWKHYLDNKIPADDKYPQPKEILGALNEIKSDDDIVATDVGQHQMWVAQFNKAQTPRTLLRADLAQWALVWAQQSAHKQLIPTSELYLLRATEVFI